MHSIVNHTISGTGWQKLDLPNARQVYGIKIQLRTSAGLEIAYQASPTHYYTVKSGSVFEDSFGAPRPQPELYVRGSDGTVVEVLLKVGL